MTETAYEELTRLIEEVAGIITICNNCGGKWEHGHQCPKDARETRFQRYLETIR